eukprot:4137319-Amphidinium_carterae.1
MWKPVWTKAPLEVPNPRRRLALPSVRVRCIDILCTRPVMEADLAALQARINEPVDTASVYDAINSVGLRLGPSFQVLSATSAEVRSDELLCASMNPRSHITVLVSSIGEDILQSNIARNLSRPHQAQALAG